MNFVVRRVAFGEYNKLNVVSQKIFFLFDAHRIIAHREGSFRKRFGLREVYKFSAFQSKLYRFRLNFLFFFYTDWPSKRVPLLITRITLYYNWHPFIYTVSLSLATLSCTNEKRLVVKRNVTFLLGLIFAYIIKRILI